MRSRVWILVFLFIAAHPTMAGTFGDFIHRVESLPVEQRRAVADSFIEATKAFPITEDSLAHFVFQADDTISVTAAGDFNGWKADTDSMRSIPGTSVHYLTKRFERDARLDYKIVADGTNWMLDPLNPNTVTGGFGLNSELAMPGYVQPDEIRFDPAIPHGRVDTLQFNSTVLNNDHRFQVFLPPGYSRHPVRRYPVLFVLDGGEYVSLGSMVNALDNLIQAKRILEIIAVFVDPVDREKEYWFNDRFNAMVTDELIPRIEGLYRTSRDPAERGVMGASLGGVTAMDLAISHPFVFGLCASQSGAFWIENGKIVKLIQNAPVENVRFYLDCGSYEPSIPGLNFQIGKILESKGCQVKTREFHEGHSWGSWRAHLDEILIFFFH